MVSAHPRPLLNHSFEGIKIKVEISLLNLIHKNEVNRSVRFFNWQFRNYFGKFLFSIRVSLWQREKFLYLSGFFIFLRLVASNPWTCFASIGDASVFSGQYKFNGSAHFSPCCVTYLTLFRSFSLAPFELGCRFLFAQQTKRRLTSTQYTSLQKINERSVNINFV